MVVAVGWGLVARFTNHRRSAWTTAFLVRSYREQSTDSHDHSVKSVKKKKNLYKKPETMSNNNFIGKGVFTSNIVVDYVVIDCRGFDSETI